MAKSDKKTDDAQAEASAMLAAMSAFSPAVAEAWLDMLSENTRFLTDRFREDVETQKAILACKTPAELMQVQSEFFKTAMSQYTDHAARLREAMTKASEDVIKDMRSGRSRGYDDVPL